MPPNQRKRMELIMLEVGVVKPNMFLKNLKDMCARKTKANNTVDTGSCVSFPTIAIHDPELILHIGHNNQNLFLHRGLQNGFKIKIKIFKLDI